MKRVLVTGASGIIGRHAVRTLVTHGLEIHALGRAKQKPETLPNSINWHCCDLLKNDVAPIIKDIAPDALLHLAWVTEHGKFWQSSQNLDWVVASIQLVRAFVENGGKRIVIAGSCAEYQWDQLKTGICDDQTPLNSTFLYGTTKNSLRYIVELYCNQHNVSFAWGRVFFVYGEGESPARLVPSVIRALKADDIARVSHCQQIRDIMSTNDCGRAFAQLLLSPVCSTLNIASGTSVTLKTVVEMIHAIIGSGTIEYGAIQSTSGEPPVLIADVKKLKELVGFNAEDSLETGLRRLISLSM